MISPVQPIPYMRNDCSTNRDKRQKVKENENFQNSLHDQKRRS